MNKLTYKCGKCKKNKEFSYPEIKKQIEKETEKDKYSFPKLKCAKCMKGGE